VFTTYDSGDGTATVPGDFKNAGRGTVNGAELDLPPEPASTLALAGASATPGYRIQRVHVSAGVNIADTQRFTNAPRLDRGASAIAEFPPEISRHVAARVDGNYQSKVYPTTDLSEFIAQDGYTLWNASLTWRSPSNKWQAALVGLNLTDKAYRITGWDAPLLGLRTAYYGPPKTVSASVTYFF
jgi:iron complex outermembrane receptor protein